MKKKEYYFLSSICVVFLFLITCLILVGCKKVLIETTEEIPSHNCNFGGEKVKIGIDENEDGILDSEEVLSNKYVCNQEAKFPVMVGEVGPISEKNRFQHPFACSAELAGLGQPEIDNQDAIGLPIFEMLGDSKTDTILGYSKNYGQKTTVSYFYKDAGADPQFGTLTPLDIDNPPAENDIADITIGNKTHKYIVRLEQGTINRFVYAIGMLAPNDNDADKPDLSAWNGILIYHFGGGIGLGHNQGGEYAMGHVGRTPSSYDNYASAGVLNQPMLERGYAVIASTGTATATTYNLVLTGETAEMVKRQFVIKYAAPKYTFGTGQSGGAIQQFIFEQNIPDLLDGLVPHKVFPDMDTHMNPVDDCNLMEAYFKLYAEDTTWWDTWAERELIEGFNAIDGIEGKPPWANTVGPGSSECVSWWPVTQILSNPFIVFGDELNPIWEYEPEAGAAVKWTHFDNLSHIFGTYPDHPEYAQQTFDNVGVQYGLNALVNGDITTEMFLDINAKIGGWKKPWEMVPHDCPLAPDCDPADVENWDAYDTRNSTASDESISIKPRAKGNIEAMNAAYRSGQVFLGDIDAPIINIQPYLDDILDVHHFKQSFVIRQRLLDVDGNADNHIIWGIDSTLEMTNPESPLLEKALDAFVVLEEWLDSGLAPTEAVDSCYGSDATLLASGTDVWDGITTDATDDNGACTNIEPFRIYKSSRMVAGEKISGFTYKCTLQSIDDAISKGVYGSVTFDAAQEAMLRQIFPDGVCDYEQPDQGRPADL